MNTIHKYPLTKALCEVKMPAGAQVLCVQMQGNHPCIWALVDPESIPVNRRFRAYGTGMPVLDSDYIGTVQESGFVWHIFEEH